MKELGGPEQVDKVRGEPEVTAWKQAARRHQHEWRTQHGWPAGLRPGTKIGELIGNRVDYAYALEHGVNFLTDDARDAVATRLAQKQPHQAIDEVRLRSDLLSSMPMCFNLFGPLWADPKLAAAVAHRWFGDFSPPDAQVHLVFEWSPGRCDPKWLDDKTAFDVAVFIDTGAERRVVGIETKYHEHPTVESLTKTNKVTGANEIRQPTARYRQVAEEANLFGDVDRIHLVWGSEAEQICRDHLLALACAQTCWHQARYVLVAPAANPAWQPLVDNYRSMLSRSAARTVEYRSVDDLLASAEDLLPHVPEFRARYLDVTVDPPAPPGNPA